MTIKFCLFFNYYNFQDNFIAVKIFDLKPGDMSIWGHDTGVTGYRLLDQGCEGVSEHVDHRDIPRISKIHENSKFLANYPFKYIHIKHTHTSFCQGARREQQ